MDNEVLKQIGYLIAGIWAAWGFAILAVLIELTANPLWIVAIEGTWYAIDTAVVFFIRYYFNVEIQTPEQRMVSVLTELKAVLPLVDPEWYNQKKEEIFKK